jgi:hypothetical protein
VPGALFELHMGFGQKRGGARHEEPHMRGQVLGEAVIAQKAGVERSEHPSSTWLWGSHSITVSGQTSA